MTTLESKDILISYADTDKELAVKLRGVLADWFGGRIWMRDFDLNGGDLIVNALQSAFSEAKWLLILLSQAAVNSQWVMAEATIGTIRAIQDENVQIIIVKVGDCEPPIHFQIAVTNKKMFDLTREQDVMDAMMQIASYIEMTAEINTWRQVYEGRGADTDQLSLVLRRNRIVFVHGWRGIGKTTFVQNAVERLMKKRTITLRLTHGHSHDLLARQIIQQMKVEQPIRIENVSDRELLHLALEALRQRANRFVLFLDDAQFALDGSNRLLPYLNDFLLLFQDANIDTKIVIATTRMPYYVEELTATTDRFQLKTIQDEYIQDIVYQWLEGTDKQRLFAGKDEDVQKLIKIIGGHPLAAKRMASFLKVHTLEQLLTTTQVQRFQIGFAELILRTTQGSLSPLHKLILQILATIVEPITLTDMLTLDVLTSSHTLEQIHSAMFDLSEWFLIEQRGELIYLHGFLVTYYDDQLRRQQKLRNRIAEEFGMYAHQRAGELNRELEKLKADLEFGIIVDNNHLVELSNNVFRYAMPADWLLRSVNKHELADSLPIRVRGTLRGMVYYFYQNVQDYHKALEYAEKWLAIDPHDSDILLYRIRCHRKFGNRGAFERALKLIADMESGDHSQAFQVRLIREKALIAYREGDVELAKAYFNEAIRKDSHYQPYSEVYAGLARILIDETDGLVEWDEERLTLANKALELLEIAKLETDNFFRFHIDAYAEALILSGKEDVAFPLLKEALSYRPDEDKLSFRMAELLRKRGQYDEAKKHARIAIQNGNAPSLITYANILYEEGLRLLEARKRDAANKRFDEALGKVEQYLKQYESTMPETKIEVANSVKSKIYRVKGELDKAYEAIRGYSNSKNPYTVYEQSILSIRKSELAEEKTNYMEALIFVREAIERVRAYPFKLPPALQQLFDDALNREQALRQVLGI
ncbi:MAG TPA: TIR domain-containing protein [Pirellulaceae bacterium]|nr:TIR domain-containing protein [Pirellulaceae bacterium]